MILESADEKVFRSDIKIFFTKMFYQLLEIFVPTVILFAIVAVAGFVIPAKSIHDFVFGIAKKIIIDWSPVFPFSSVLFVEFFLVLLRYIIGRQKVIISDEGLTIRRWGRVIFFLYLQGEISFSHEQKVYWKRNEIEYFVGYSNGTGEELKEAIELFCFGSSAMQVLEEDVRKRKKQAEGVLLDEADTELMQTKPVTIYVPKDKILSKEWRVTGWSFAGGIAACGGIGFLVYRFGEDWGRHVAWRFILAGVLIFLTVTIRLIRTVLDQKSVPERIYIFGDYLRVDGENFWLKDVGQIEFSEKKVSKDKSEQNRWYFQFWYKGKKRSYWLGTESSLSTIKFGQIKREIRKSLAKYPEKLVD